MFLNIWDQFKAADDTPTLADTFYDDAPNDETADDHPEDMSTTTCLQLRSKLEKQRAWLDAIMTPEHKPKYGTTTTSPTQKSERLKRFEAALGQPENLALASTLRQALTGVMRSLPERERPVEINHIECRGGHCRVDLDQTLGLDDYSRIAKNSSASDPAGDSSASDSANDSAWLRTHLMGLSGNSTQPVMYVQIDENGFTKADDRVNDIIKGFERQGYLEVCQNQTSTQGSYRNAVRDVPSEQEPDEGSESTPNTLHLQLDVPDLTWRLAGPLAHTALGNCIARAFTGYLDNVRQTLGQTDLDPSDTDHQDHKVHSGNSSSDWTTSPGQGEITWTFPR